MRYTPPVIVLALASATFVAAIWILAIELNDRKTGPTVLVVLLLLLISFVVGAWAVGRIRRIRSLTPEAIISPPHASGS